LLLLASMWQSTRLHAFTVALTATTLVALCSGCYAEATVPPAYVEADAAPVDIEVAPHAYYEGRTVYYVNDHWYARDRGRWVYYRSEPAPLVRQRTHVERAPRAPDREQERYVARPRTEAPPAVRVQ
jgi:hypothetical protein